MPNLGDKSQQLIKFIENLRTLADLLDSPQITSGEWLAKKVVINSPESLSDTTLAAISGVERVYQIMDKKSGSHS